MVSEPTGLGALEVLVPEFAGVSAAGHVTVARRCSTVGHDGSRGFFPTLTVP